MRHASSCGFVILCLISTTASASAVDMVFTSFQQPCRAIDTRLEGGPLAPLIPRSFKIAGTTGFTAQGGTAGGCGVPTTATAVSINFVAVNPSGAGNLRGAAYPNDVPSTGSIINYQLLSPNLNIANGLTFPICDRSGDACDYDIKVLANGASVHLVADLLGYFTADHKHDGDDITTGTVAEARIDPSVARDSEIMPAVLASDGSGSGLDADTLDGIDGASIDATYEKKYARTVIVRSGGTDAQNGTALLNAAAGITGASATNPYLLKLEPGIYDLGASPLMGPANVDVEGSGELRTKIKTSNLQAAVWPGDNTELRHLTIENAGVSGNPAYAISAADVSTRLFAVTLIAYGGESNAGFHGELYEGSHEVIMKNVTVRITGGSSLNWGINCFGGGTQTVTIDSINVRIEGGSGSRYGIEVDSFPASISNADVSVVGDGAIGVVLSHSLSRLDRIRASVSGPNSTGMFVDGNVGSPGTGKVSNSEFTAVGTGSAGISLYEASLTLLNITAEGASYGINLMFLGGLGGNVQVKNSTLSGAVASVDASFGGFTVRIGASHLKGGPVAAAAGLVTCAGVYDENYVFSASTCP